jgi:hypothetical protein
MRAGDARKEDTMREVLDDQWMLTNDEDYDWLDGLQEPEWEADCN